MSSAALRTGELVRFALAWVAGCRTTPAMAFSLTRTSGQIPWVTIMRISITSVTHRSCRTMWRHIGQKLRSGRGGVGTARGVRGPTPPPLLAHDRVVALILLLTAISVIER